VDGARRAMPVVVGDRQDDRFARIVSAGRDLAAEGLEIRPLAMAERFRTGAADTVVLGFFLANGGFALGLDARQLELLAHNGGQFLQRPIDFEDVGAGFTAGLAFPIPLLAFAASAGDRLGDFAVPLPRPARALLALAGNAHRE